MTLDSIPRAPKTLLIACGALAREILLLIEINKMDHLEVQCLPASLHNRPEKIPEAMRAKIHENRDDYDRIVALYADCGTGGMLDKVLEEEGVERIAGAHCYEFYSGTSVFNDLMEQELGTFYLTDYLVRQFEVLIIKGLGLDKHPELRPMYFGNYKRLVYLAQTEDPALCVQAEKAAEALGLEYEYVFTGLDEFSTFLKQQ
jgi:hypothetical protein